MTDKELIAYRTQWINYYRQKEYGRKAIVYNLRLAINKKISAIARSTPPEEKNEAFWERMRDMREEYLRFEWPSCSRTGD